jgi:hypothetical protein
MSRANPSLVLGKSGQVPSGSQVRSRTGPGQVPVKPQVGPGQISGRSRLSLVQVPVKFG